MAYHLNRESVIAWVWFGDDRPVLERLHEAAKSKAESLNISDLGLPYPKNRSKLPGGINEQSIRRWIDSVSSEDEQEILGRLLKTMECSLGLEEVETAESKEDIEILKPYDSGLKGEIFEARQKSLKRKVGVKFIKQEFGVDAGGGSPASHRRYEVGHPTLPGHGPLTSPRGGQRLMTAKISLLAARGQKRNARARLENQKCAT